MVKIVAAIERLVKNSQESQEWWECVCIYFTFPSNILHHIANEHPFSEVVPNELKNRGIPINATHRVDQTFRWKNYPASGKGMTWLSLSEIRKFLQTLVPQYNDLIPEYTALPKDMALESALTLMREIEKTQNTTTRLIFWSELVEPPK